MIDLVPLTVNQRLASRKRGVSRICSRVDVPELQLRVTLRGRLFDAKGNGEAVTICSGVDMCTVTL